MAVSRPRSIPASKFRVEVPLIGVKNGTNTTFTTPETFRQSPPIAVYWNGVRQRTGEDFTAQESGGVGSGHDTIEMTAAPLAEEHLFADYVAI